VMNHLAQTGPRRARRASRQRASHPPGNLRGLARQQRLRPCSRRAALRSPQYHPPPAPQTRTAHRPRPRQSPVGCPAHARIRDRTTPTTRFNRRRC
jgi:hypothetical protein